jgi:glycosyltransferase involved in cell wall biosynthesis
MKIQPFSAKTDLISVLLPVYNGSAYLEESIKSILDQTYSNFEIIIINDGSTDESPLIIQKFKDDQRIRFFNQQNQGLSAALNRAIGLAKGKYLARQDQDDISLPLRFEKQIEFLENHPDYAMVGTWAEILGEKTRTRRSHKHPAESSILKFDLLFNNPFVHSSVMMRKSTFDQIGLYSTDKSRQPPEDYELWSRIAKKFEVANIPEILLIYREVPGSMSRDKLNPLLERLVRISAENLAWFSGRKSSDTDCADLAALTHGVNHRFSHGLHFKEFAKLLNSAAQQISISAGCDEKILQKRAKSRLQSIKNYYFCHKYGRTIGLALALLDSMKMVMK